MKKWRVAIVGAGYMAQEHARAFASLASVEIVGVCGRTKSRADALANAHGTVAYESIEAMYQGTHADAVVVAVNELSMQVVCDAVFRRPWLCFLEKPVGIDLPQALAIQASARSSGSRAFVALNRRSYSATRKAVEELSQSEGPRLISVLDQQDAAAAAASGQPQRVVRNYMFANSIHLVDYFCLFGRGEVDSVTPAVPWREGGSPYVVATIHFCSGDVGVYQAVWDGPGPWSVTVTDRAVRLELRPLERLGIQRRGERRLTEVATDPVDSDFKPGLRYQAEQVVRLLEGSNAALPTLDDATRSMTLCAEIYGQYD